MNPAIETAKKMTRVQTDWLHRTMQFIPEDKLTWRAGGCAKTPLEIYLECGQVYLTDAKLLRADTIDWTMPEAEECQESEIAITFVEKAQREFLIALEALPESRLVEMVDLPWGGSMAINDLIFSPSYHTAYHCGQLNYIQTLLDDNERHFSWSL